MSTEIRLSSTSYVVLGMLAWLGPSSPYRLKKYLQQSIADFHAVPHTTFYAEPARLAAAGYLDETQEEGGRRRKRYALTDRGRAALADWLADPSAEPVEMRATALLKVFFGADPEPLARREAERHRRMLEQFERFDSELDLPSGPRRALPFGLAFHRMWIERWERLGDRDGDR